MKFESASGIILIIAAVLALLMANSPLASYYGLFLDMPVEIRVGPFNLAKPLLLWINDGLMSVFFFLVGMELKREIFEGELSSLHAVVFPAVGALGGMLIPALTYFYFNQDDLIAVRGWAIPAATDIAFALGVLSLVGRKVPPALKIFLVSLAIFDDIGAIVIIALFYSSGLSLSALTVAAVCLVVLFVLNRRNVVHITAYIFVGFVMWVAVLKSGVHATLAGVVLAFFIPMYDKTNMEYSPVRELEHDLNTAVAFGILPLFAFANSGISIMGVGVDYLLHPVPLGIAAGLFIGKQLGVFGFCWVGVKLGLMQLPRGITWSGLYGVALLCGIGFTMSLFIGSLAFEAQDRTLLFDERFGILVGSLFSAVAGWFVLRWSLGRNS